MLVHHRYQCVASRGVGDASCGKGQPSYDDHTYLGEINAIIWLRERAFTGVASHRSHAVSGKAICLCYVAMAQSVVCKGMTRRADWRQTCPVSDQCVVSFILAFVYLAYQGKHVQTCRRV